MSRAYALIRSATLHGYAPLARSLGLDPAAMLRAAGLPPDCGDDPEAPISVVAVRRLLEDSAQAAGIEDFGLRMARDRRLAHLGPISLVLREEPTARQALDTLCRYLRLVNASLRTQIEEQDGLVLIREAVVVEDGGTLRQSIEMAVGVMYRILVELMGAQWRPRSVCFLHRPPRDAAGHRAFFHAPMEFNAGFDGIVCAARDLAAPLPPADSGLAGYARRVLDQAMANPRRDTLDAARQLVAALLPGGRCTAEQVAAHLGMDRRTLHRHLAEHGETFSSLMQAVRAEFAQRQIRDSDRPLAELAELLGFSGASAFAYWFRQRFGCTVMQWRRAQEGG